MKKMLKSYLVFTPALYRLIAFLLLPLLLIALQLWLANQFFVVLAYVTLLLFMSAEIMLDNWVFGGIATKAVRQPEYLKSSRRGMSVMTHALAVNTVRPFVEGALILLIGAVCAVGRGGGPYEGRQVVTCLALLFFFGFLTTLALTIVRFFDGVMVNMSAVYIVDIIYTGIFFIVQSNAYWLLPVSIVLAVGTGIVGVKLILKRLEESYYDETA